MPCTSFRLGATCQDRSDAPGLTTLSIPGQGGQPGQGGLRSWSRVSLKTHGFGHGQHDAGNHDRKPAFSDGQRGGFLNRSMKAPASRYSSVTPTHSGNGPMTAIRISVILTRHSTKPARRVGRSQRGRRADIGATLLDPLRQPAAAPPVARSDRRSTRHPRRARPAATVPSRQILIEHKPQPDSVADRALA
jgi:hypothetical protein